MGPMPLECFSKAGNMEEPKGTACSEHASEMVEHD